MDPVAKRIFELADIQFAEQQEFAIAIEKKPSVVSQWRMGRTKSFRSCLPQIAEALGTTTEYLLTGEGPKKKPAPAVSDSDTLTNEEEHLISTYRQAAPELQSAVRRVLGLE